MIQSSTTMRTSILLYFLAATFWSTDVLAQAAPIKNDISFGQYLILTGQYELAVLEFERLYFLNPETEGIQHALIETHRTNGNYKRALTYAHTFSLQPSLNKQEAAYFKKEIILNALLLKDLVWIPSALAEIRIAYENEPEMLVYADNMSLGMSILNAKSKNETYHIHLPGIENQHDATLVQALNDWHQQARKSPFVAGAMSTILPGSGKVYAGKWKDGLVSLLFVGANAHSSYRGFRSVGVRSPYGWLFGGLAFGFYAGGIYGAQKAAKIYNHELETKIKADVYSRLLLYR